MLRQRLTAASIIILTMFAILWLDYQLGTPAWLGRPGIIFAALSVVLAALAAAELMDMWLPRFPGLSIPLAVFAAVAMVILSNMPLAWLDYPADCVLGKFGWSLSGLIVALVMAFFFEMYRFEKNSSSSESGQSTITSTDRLAHYALAFTYLQMLFGFIAAHRTIGNSNAIGLISVITLIATAKMSDSFAYFTGKTLGRHKLAPALSPNKTVEGALGSFVGAWLAAAIVLFLVAPQMGVTVDKPWWWFLVYGFLVTLAGMAGDLAVSLMKRDAGCKDSSRWLPGLGGVLDVMDSLVFAVPVSYFLWML